MGSSDPTTNGLLGRVRQCYFARTLHLAVHAPLCRGAPTRPRDADPLTFPVASCPHAAADGGADGVSQGALRNHVPATHVKRSGGNT